MRHATRLLAAAAGAYALGSVPFADAAARIVSRGRVDLRAEGSRNPGAVNVRRLLGRRAGRAVTVADIAKGAAACAWGRRCAGDLGAHVAGVAAVVGHCYPAWARFRGGKGVATSFGQCLYTLPLYAPIDAAVATAVARIPSLRRPALVSVGTASIAWIGAGLVWWRLDLPTLWGPRPSAALPLANAASVGAIASRALVSLWRDEPDELALPR